MFDYNREINPKVIILILNCQCCWVRVNVRYVRKETHKRHLSWHLSVTNYVCSILQRDNMQSKKNRCKNIAWKNWKGRNMKPLTGYRNSWVWFCSLTFFCIPCQQPNIKSSEMCPYFRYSDCIFGLRILSFSTQTTFKTRKCHATLFACNVWQEPFYNVQACGKVFRNMPWTSLDIYFEKNALTTKFDSFRHYRLVCIGSPTGFEYILN